VNELRELLRAVAAYASGGMKGAQRSALSRVRARSRSVAPTAGS
jgi:hypothetical protein